ncbi:hypothetical protein [Nonomuraea sp. SYSU D8015]|uniref:hypothetical protein n=1 Tax=Nonomuraea sp. SYSU D8015 TaxID=2593644 RepID=UPI0016613A38|nr:hypothetical protein [Nonomuraea sp. SYSU D8015]
MSTTGASANTKLEPCQELRQAATTLRETAANATRGPWRRVADADPDFITRYSPNHIANWEGDYLDSVANAGDGEQANRDASWICLVSPLLAEPLAALLDHFAAKYERLHEIFGAPISGPDDRLAKGEPELHVDFALAVARVINGTAPTAGAR